MSIHAIGAYSCAKPESDPLLQALYYHWLVSKDNLSVSKRTVREPMSGSVIQGHQQNAVMSVEKGVHHCS